MTGIVVATGTRREGGVLSGPAWIVVPGGGDAAGLSARLTRACEGASGILSFGMAGALAEGLALGDWVVGDRVTGVSEAGCDPAWRDALAAALGARIGGIYADGRMIAAPAQKRALGERLGALAVDMESHVAASVARARGLPFAVARCISDELHRALPAAIAVAMRPDGTVAVAEVLRSLAREPRQLPGLIRTGAGFARAMHSLRTGGTALSRAAERMSA